MKSLEIKYIRQSAIKKSLLIKVFKNSLMKKAFEKTKNEKLISYLSGQNLVLFSNEDISEPIKFLLNLKKKLNKLKIKFICIYGNLFFERDIEELTKIPNRAEALFNLVRCLKAPIIKVHSNLYNPFKKLCILTKLIVKK